jgi:malonyl-CoA decarboxylase
MTMLSGLLATIFERRGERRAPTNKRAQDIEDIARDLVAAPGDGAAQSLAEDMIERYRELDDAAKLRFFRFLAVTLNISPQAIRHAINAYEESPSRESYEAFMRASEPARQELIRRLNQAPGATEVLVGMRADLLRLGRMDPRLMILDSDFRHLFASWFNRGFLVLRPISWESPAHILEKIIAYEAVHAIDSWHDLRRRLEPEDRRCFAFFHPVMPNEPLIFIEVALTQSVATSIQSLLADGRTVVSSEASDTAVFYSISNCQAGLAGISFGHSLIKQVVADLSVDLPQLKTFVTLSPMPGFGAWLDTKHLERDGEGCAALRSLAATYLLHAKDSAGRPLDPVARFHLGNGAEVHDLHVDADTSPTGLHRSAGVMVNYLYDAPNMKRNQERFTASGDVMAADRIRSLCSVGEPVLETVGAR